MNYPRLNDTKFPNIENLNAYTFKNDFNYERWQADCVIKLVKVPWHDGYEHVVEFASELDRDNYFDNLSGEVVQLTADSRRVSNSIRIPLTYEQASQYNYVTLLSPYPGLEYQESAPRRLFYFISNIEYAAPNATMLELSLDIWTTYRNDVTISGMLLERGHAPMDSISAGEYLTNPQAKAQYLLTPDVDFGGSGDKVSSAQVLNFGDTTRYVVFASTIPEYYFVRDLPAPDTDSNSSGPTFSDNPVRYGYQYNVNNYVWASGRNYSGTMIEAAPSTSGSNVTPEAQLYAVKADTLFNSQASGWSEFAKEVPNFIKSCVAMFILPREILADALRLATTYEIGNYTFYALHDYARNFTQNAFTLTQELFGFNSKYKDIAKLYTYPYSYLEFSNDAGSTVQVKVETIAGSEIRAIHSLSLAFPYLNWGIALDNIGSSSHVSYTWSKLDGNTKNLSTPHSDFINTTIELGIPTYALYLNGLLEVQSDYGAMQAERNNAIVSYHNTLRSVNTGHANAVASNATMVSNTANSGNTATANTALQVATSSSNTASSNANSALGTLTANTIVGANLLADQVLQAQSIDTQREAMTASNTNSAISAIGGGAVTGAAGSLAAVGTAALAGAEVGAFGGPAGVIGGAAIAAGVSALGGAIHSYSANLNSVISFNASAEIASATQANAATHASNAQSQASTMTTMSNNLATTICDNQNALATGSTANNVDLANTNAQNTASTSNSNSLYTRNATVDAAQDTLRAAQANYSYRVQDARQNPPRQYGAYSGNFAHAALGREYLKMRVRTQPDAAIAQAGDYFLRYGYAYNGWVNYSKPSKKFSYWKATDVWITTNNNVNDGIKIGIESILQAGVTVWKNPDDVGNVSIYER